MFLTISSIYNILKKLFLYKNNKDIFIKMRSKNYEGLDFQNWVFNNPFNQITLNFFGS